MTDRSDRLIDDLHARPRGAARDIAEHMQCFDANGKPLFDLEEIRDILKAVGAMAAQAASEGDDRRLKRMLDAQLKLAAVNAKLIEGDKDAGELNDILTRLRDRQRATGAN